MNNLPTLFLGLSVLFTAGISSVPAFATPPELRPWLASPQAWLRDTDGPILSLGPPGRFDDTHVFAPAVAHDGDLFKLWYSGSRGAVHERVFRLGLATSGDGRSFERQGEQPVYEFGDGKHSILTPALLRRPDGTTLREDGRLRLWFSSTWFAGESQPHTLHETSSEDGVRWSEPSAPLMKDVYAPSVIRSGQLYRMWFTDVSAEPWCIRHASSPDGRSWRLTPEPCVVVDQAWEKQNLFYPTVLRIGGVYLMWYGSYWSERPDTTALGFAASLDGLKWYKHPQNPVFRPDPARPWESHYVTSQSIMPLTDGSLRMWYASRKAPPFVNKYFAINTAVWKTGGESEDPVHPAPRNPKAFAAWQAETRRRLSDMLGIPRTRVPLEAERRGQFEWDGIVIEKWVFTSEPGSRVPAVLYRPKQPDGPMPAIVLTFGHGGSKSQWQYNYAGQLFAKMGLACLALDPIGEEERHHQGRLGTRAHDPRPVSDRADKAERLIMGKLVFDTMRGIDLLLQRDDVDPQRIGVAGNSLGGAKAGWMAALEPRIKMAVVSGWAYDDVTMRSKYCTKLPNQRMREHLTWVEYAALAAPDCALLIMNGDADGIIDRDQDGAAWAGTRRAAEGAARIYEQQGAPGKILAWFEPGGGHRPYFVYKEALQWIHRRLGTPAMTADEIRALPTVNSGVWCDTHGIRLERLYGTDLHQRGAALPDLGLRPTPREELSCLKAGELGSPEFTLEGWLQQIEKH